MEEFGNIQSAEQKKLEKSVNSFRNVFVTFSKRALFFTSLPFYWIVFFNYILNWFDYRFFAFVVIISAMMSFFGQGWGLLNFLVK